MAKPSPRFRKDLVAAATEAEGVACVEVQDPLSGTSFTLYDFEYQLAMQMDGQPLTDLVAWGASTYGLELTPDSIEEFAGRLAELGFLEGTPGAVPAAESVAGSSQADSAEAEWNSLEGARTSQYVPDEAMLQGGPSDLTPAFPLAALARGDGEVDASAAAVDSAPTMTGFEGAGQARQADEAKAATPRRDDQQKDELDVVAELPADALVELNESGPAAAGKSSGTFPSGIVERRQPPRPDSVVMAPFEDVSRRFRAPPPERQRSSTGLVVAAVGLLVVGGGGLAFYLSHRAPTEPQALRLRVTAPRPTAVYRWFATAGTVVDLEARTLSFESAGHVVELLPAGTKFTEGEILGKLQGAAALEGELAKHKSRLAFLEQLRDSMKASGNKAQLRDTQDKLTARKKLIDEAQASLNKLVLRATEPGTIVATTAKVGEPVALKAPALKWRGRNLHGDFTMDQEDFLNASKLDFCRVEVVALGASGSSAAPPPAPASPDGREPQGSPRFMDCKLPPAAPVSPSGPSPLRKFIVTFPSDAGLVTGQGLHLARRRYDGVFPVPLTAVQMLSETEAKLWVATATGTAEPRDVTVAESRDEALVSKGLNVGDEIIVEPPHDLQPGARLEPIR